MKIATLALAAVLIAGTASARQAVTPAADSAARTFTGWVRIDNGEYQLLPEQRDLTRPFARPCVSVVLPRGLQRSSADIAGTQVTFTGRAVPWAERDSAQVMRFKGSQVANECGGETVIQADSFRVRRAG